MKNRYLLVVIVVICSIFSCSKPNIKSLHIEDKGVSLELAQYRQEQVKDVAYKLFFAIPEQEEEVITAQLQLQLKIEDLTLPLYLDFKEDKSAIKAINVNGQASIIEHKKEHLIIAKELLNKGVNTIVIDFEAGELSLNRNEDYLYTLLVPDRARTLFPCFDQPDIKAVYELIIKAPQQWQVLCGAPLKFKETKEGATTYHFEKSDKMSTYLFSFVAGRFDYISSQNTQQEMKMLYRETDTDKITSSITPIFDLHQKSLDFLETYTDVKYPFKKMDFAVIPGFQYGGMEHTGAIQYRESTLFLDQSATKSQELARAKLIAHETSHMWFGNLVTMEWFNDVWMKEVFANFMADKIVNPVFETVNHDLKFLTIHYPSAYSVDRTQGTNPIRQELNNLANAGSLYGRIIYNKSPIMMRQLEQALGEDRFKEGIRSYIKTYANGNTDWDGLINILDQKSELDLKAWSEVWVNASGRPVFSDKIVYDDGGKIKSFSVSQQAEDGSNKLWPQSFDVSLVYPNHTDTVTITSDKKVVEIPQLEGKEAPLYILYNSNGLGYGVFPSNEKNATLIHEIKDEVARAHAYLNNFENVLAGNLSSTKVFESLRIGIENESNELILSLLTREANYLFWNILTAKHRLLYQKELEETLFSRLENSDTQGLKKILFNAYKAIAYSKKGRSNLYALWNKELHIANLVLNKDDYTRLAQQLALFGHKEAEVILAKAKSELKNPDKIKRFEFIAQALHADFAVRSAFFNSFKDQKSRAKESWVNTACYFMHHPLRQHEAINDVGLSMELLEEIQETGDIFFPLRWLQNTIGQYSSKEAFEKVEDYVKRHPELDKNLKGKLLQATDKLYRKYKTNYHQ